MPWPYTWPIVWESERVLKLILKTIHSKYIESTIDEPLRVIEKPVPPMEIDSEINPVFVMRTSYSRSLRITTGIEGGG